MTGEISELDCFEFNRVRRKGRTRDRKTKEDSEQGLFGCMDVAKSLGQGGRVGSTVVHLKSTENPIYVEKPIKNRRLFGTERVAKSSIVPKGSWNRK